MILVFAGAGSSASVDCKKFPTTIEFFKRLPKDIKDDPLYNYVHGFLEQKKGSLIDIEDVLEAFNDFNEFFDKTLHPPGNIVGWMMDKNRLTELANNINDINDFGRSIIHNQTQTEAIVKSRELFSRRGSSLRDNINNLVHSFYNHTPDKKQLTNWAAFIKDLQSSILDTETVEIFTTNYDLVLEQVIEKYKLDIETGRKSNNLQTTLNMTLWSPQPPTNNRGKLTKLHGSMDWQRNSDGTIVASSVSTENPEKQAILYPGAKKELQKEPFTAFHEHLRKIVDRADVAIFIGYSFRDEHINEILYNSPLSARKYIICKDEKPPPLIPFNKGDYLYYDTGFNKDCINKILDDLNKPIS